MGHYFAMTGSEKSLTLFYHPNSPPCRVVWSFLLENHIQCKLELVNLFQNEQLDEAYVALNPAHTVPTLVENRFVLYESCAIVRYLAASKEDVASNWCPKDPKEKALSNQFISWSKVHIREAVNLYLNAVLWKPLQNISVDPEEQQKQTQKLKNNLQILEKALDDKTTLVGSKVSLCDLVIAEELVNLELVDFDYDDCVNIQQWLFFVKQNVSCWDKVHQFFNQVYKPTIQKAMKK